MLILDVDIKNYQELGGVSGSSFVRNNNIEQIFTRRMDAN
jgi:hypothetical protein